MKTPLIIGAGPAGSAAAIMLARGGAKPLMLEAARETGDALCGGFLSWRTLETLRSLGIDVDDLGGHRVNRIRLFSAKSSASTALPAGAIGLSRRRLDTLLSAQAERAGATMERGTPVRALEADGSITLKDGGSVTADTIFIATGKHDLRGLGRTRADAPTLGLRIRIAAHPGLTRLIGDTIELHLFDHGYAGLLLQEDGSANLCMAVRKDRLTAADGDPLRLINALGRELPYLGERLAYCADSDKIDAIAAVPYGWIGGETTQGLFRLGDQAACIPSLAGEGNGLALASGIRAAKAWDRGGAAAAPDFQRAFAKSAARPVGIAKMLWHGAENPRTNPYLVAATAMIPGIARLAARLTRIDH
jgi:menaquinone-9 beta-reductase